MELIVNTPNVKLIVLYRQVDDVIKSQLRYSEKTKYHPDFKELQRLKDDSDKLDFISSKYKTDYSKWISDWKKSNLSNCIIMKYEDLTKNPLENFYKLFRRLDFNLSIDDVDKLLKKYSKSNMLKLSLHKEFYSRNL